MQGATSVIKGSYKEGIGVPVDVVLDNFSSARGEVVRPDVVAVDVHATGCYGVVRHAVFNGLEVEGENDDGFGVVRARELGDFGGFAGCGCGGDGDVVVGGSRCGRWVDGLAFG